MGQGRGRDIEYSPCKALIYMPCIVGTFHVKIPGKGPHTLAVHCALLYLTWVKHSAIFPTVLAGIKTLALPWHSWETFGKNTVPYFLKAYVSDVGIQAFDFLQCLFLKVPRKK